jgi:inner membrane protein
MATPLGHALAGVAVGVLITGRRPLTSPGKDLLIFAALAQAPDLDFIPGLIIGQPGAFHHGLSHSLGASLVVGLLAAWWGRRRSDAFRWGLVGASICFAQVLVDALTLDTTAPIGVPLWWPLTSEYFCFHPIFKDVVRGRLTWDLIRHNLLAAAWEAVVLGSLAALSLAVRRRPKRKPRSLALPPERGRLEGNRKVQP